MAEYTQDELLKFALENGTINFEAIKSEKENMERQELLKKHPYKIWKGKDGKYYTYFPDEERGRIRRQKSSQKAIEDLIVSYWKEKEELVTVGDVFKDWNDHRLELGQISKSTHSRNEDVYKRHFKDFGKRDIKQITPDDIEDFFVLEISRCNLTSKAFTNLKCVMSGILKRAKKRGLSDLIAVNVMNEIDLSEVKFTKNVKREEDDVYNEKELGIVLDYLNENVDLMNLGVMLIFFTGLRVGELVALKWEDIDFANNIIRVCRTETAYYNVNGHTKTYEVKDFPKTEAGIRNVIVPKDYMWILYSLHNMTQYYEYIFTRNGERLKAQSIRRRMYKICDKVGLKHKSPHKGRKTYASILLDNNVDENLIIKMMGHTNISCTENYYYKNRKTLNTQQAIINSIPEFQSSDKDDSDK